MIVLTAPTSRIGSKLLPTLLEAGEDVRVILRDPRKLPDDIRGRVEVVAGSHRDPDVVDAAFPGADAVFWLMPADRAAAGIYDTYVTASIPGADGLVRHGVRRVVTVSALGRGTGLYAGHVSASLAMDDLFRSTGVHVRALANPTFMDNVIWQVPALRDGVLRGTLPGDLALPAVATRDIADAAAALLLGRTWTGQDTVDLLGPEDISPVEMARVLSEVAGHPVRYERGSRADMKAALRSSGYSGAIAQAMIDMDLAKEHGLDRAVARTADNSTPTSFRLFAEEALAPLIAG